MIDLFTSFQNLTTDDQKRQAANEMALTPAMFAVETHYDSRMFAMYTGADIAEKFGTFVINQCVREALWRILYEVQTYTENHVGYNISRRSHSEKFQVSSFEFKTPFKLQWPGIELADTAPVWTGRNLFGTVNYFVYETDPSDITDPMGNGDYVVEVPMELVSNPNEVLMRKNNGTSYGVFPILRQNHYPRRSGTSWLIQIDNHKVAYDPGEGLVVQSTKYGYVDITPPMGMTGELRPVYPGTIEQIPYVRKEVLDGGDLRYWFYLYNLIDPAFDGDDNIDLVQAHFYKLMPQVEFKEYSEEAQAAVLEVVTRGDCCDDCGGEDRVTRRYQVSTRVVDSARGIVQFAVDGELITDPDTEEVTLETASMCNFSNDPCLIYNLTVWYITNPAELPERAKGSVPNLVRAVMYRSAADLPVEDCLCTIEYGFIKSAQEAYGTIATTISGAVIESNKYGSLHGHKVFGEILGNAFILKSTRVKGSANERR